MSAELSQTNPEQAGSSAAGALPGECVASNNSIVFDVRALTPMQICPAVWTLRRHVVLPVKSRVPTHCARELPSRVREEFLAVSRAKVHGLADSFRAPAARNRGQPGRNNLGPMGSAETEEGGLQLDSAVGHLDLGADA